MKFRLIGKLESIPVPPLRLICPHCGHKAIFESLGMDFFQSPKLLRSEYYNNFSFGIRRCPHEACHGHLFFVYDNMNNKIVTTYPPETIAFETDNIPERVLNTFREAVICHANKCYTASAIMIRKTLEEICEEKGAQGKNLFEKLENLRESIVIPQALLEAMQDMRIFGNDAAHTGSQVFKEINQEGVELCLELAKEIMKALYQYENLVKKLKDMKNKPQQ